MKKVFALAGIAAVALFVSSCGSSTPSIGETVPEVWQVAVNSISTTDSIDPGFGSVYEPDAGYMWAKIDLTIKNLKREQNTLNWFLDTFKYAGPDGNTYSQSLLYLDPPGHIDTSFNPQQTKSGYRILGTRNLGRARRQVAVATESR